MRFRSIPGQVVDNTDTEVGGAWTRLSSGELNAAKTSPNSDPFLVIKTDGADLTRILGGSQNDTLNIISELNRDIDGSITADRVELTAGQRILEPVDFSTFVNPTGLITFDQLTNAASDYIEDGFKFEINDGDRNLAREDTFGSAVQIKNNRDMAYTILLQLNCTQDLISTIGKIHQGLQKCGRINKRTNPSAHQLLEEPDRLNWEIDALT